MILLAAISKIVFWQFFLQVFQLTRDMSLNKMIPFNGSPVDILSHKSQL